MTEVSRAAQAEARRGKETERDDATTSGREVFRFNDRDWLLMGLEDGSSWNLYGPDADPADPGARRAHITIAEHGYLSVDPEGVVRGPYTTLSEAAYPIAEQNRVLLDAPSDRARVEPPHRDLGATLRLVTTTLLIGTAMIGAALVARPLLRRGRGAATRDLDAARVAWDAARRAQTRSARRR